MALIFDKLVQFWWITPHWKAIMLLFSNKMRLITFHVTFLPTSAVFHRFQAKYDMWHHSTQFKPHLMFLVYLFATNLLPVCKPLKRLKNEGSTMFRGSVVQKLEEKRFSVNIWVIIIKYAYVSRKWMVMTP